MSRTHQRGVLIHFLNSNLFLPYAARNEAHVKAAYARLRWLDRQHHARFAHHVESMDKKLTCQECGGAGRWQEIIDPWIGGPWEECGWCEGTGLVTSWLRGQWLKYKRQEKCEAA